MAKIDSGPVARIAAAITAAMIAAALSGCTGTGADIVSYAFVTTDKYQYFDCESIANQITAMTANEKRLEQLMAKAGPVISAATYQPEYLATRGELRELRRTAAQKHCEAKADKPAGSRTSNTVAR